ncbi:MAG: hypothetical protein AB1806_21475 [Acidobacteriota bacterium]
MLADLLELSLIAYLPGAVIFRMPMADRARRASLAAEERAFWAVVVSLALTTLLVLALAGLGLYTWNRLLVAHGVLTGAMLAIFRARLRFSGRVSRPGWSALAPIGLVALGSALYFPSSEYVMGGKDPGTYMNEGIQIAQRGSLRIPDPTIAEVPPDLRELFLIGELESDLYQGTRFMGFFVMDRDAGVVMGQFPHAFPSWIAVGYGLDGLSGARRAVGFWAVLGLLAVYFCAMRLVGPVAAGAAAGLLALNVATVWFARYPNSEMMQQALAFAGLLALGRSVIDEDPFFAPAAGTLFGLMLFIRIDAILLFVGAAAGLVLVALQGRAPRWTLLAPFLILFGVAGRYLTAWMAPYIDITMAQLRGYPGIAGGAAAMVCSWWMARRLYSRAPLVARGLQTWIPRVLVGGVVLLAAYAYFFREPVGRLALHDAYALRFYSWYVGPAGLLAAVLGFALMGWRRFWRDPFLMATGALVAFVVFYKIRIVPEHFWQARRFVPIVLPFTCIMIAGGVFGAFEAWRPGRHSTPAGRPAIGAVFGRVLLPCLVVAAVAWPAVQRIRPILPHVEYAGLIPEIERFVPNLGNDDLVVVESRNASDVHVLATPLAYIYDRHVLVLASPRPDPGAFERFLHWAGAKYERVFLLVSDGGTDLGSAHIEARPMFERRFVLPEYESSRNAYPTGVRTKAFNLTLYALSLSPEPVSVRDVDVGGYDDLRVLRMHGKEQRGETTFRWTGPYSYVTLQGLRPNDKSLALWMSAGRRPSQVPVARVRVLLNDQPLAQLDVSGELRRYDVAIPPEVAAAAAARQTPSTLRFECNTWVPGDVVGGPDRRALGVILDRVKVE